MSTQERHWLNQTLWQARAFYFKVVCDRDLRKEERRAITILNLFE